MREIQFKKKPNSPDEIKKVLHPLVKKWFFSKFKGFAKPQLYGVMPIHARENILVSAPTGTGKTVTAFLSILNELVDSAEKGILEDRVYAVYISPLKALNEDIRVNLLEPLKEIEEIAGKPLGIRVSVRTGDTPQSEKSKMLKQPPHILITTPESMSIMLASIKFPELLQSVDWCIVDEIHALAENKRGVHLSLSLELLDSLNAHMCRVGLSATVHPLENIAQFLVGNGRPCQIVDVQFIKQMDIQVMSPVKDLVNTTYVDIHANMYKELDRLIQAHKTTLIFTNTRAGTERMVDHLKDKFPSRYHDNIGAHHGSLSKPHRHALEKKLREGKVKAVVCSTSLELGIDIGNIDLVVCMGSPKSVARLLQRAGRAGHKLDEVTKCRIMVMNHDDLIECSVMLKNAIEHQIDKVHIPANCLDVLAQQLAGFALTKVWDDHELYQLVKKSYCYRDLTRKDFNDTIDYLAGKFTSLETRNVFAKIWHNEGQIGRRGRLARVLYMTNIGTIPDQSFIQVKIGDQVIGTLDEGFLEKMSAGDVFVLGGDMYQFKYARGQTIQVKAAVTRPPTVPSWVSEMLPLSFDLATAIGKFRRLMQEKFALQKSKKEIMKFIHEYLYVDDKAAASAYYYCKAQYDYCKILPNDKLIMIEHYVSDDDAKIIVHSLFGRRVNDCLSRAIAFAISRTQHRDVMMGINDNGFYLSCEKPINVPEAIKLLKAEKLDLVLNNAIEKSEVFRRRFRHCAARSLMILRNYKGRRKRVGRQQVTSNILLPALRQIDPNFSIIREAKREVLEDLMDIKNTAKVLEGIEQNKIQVKEIMTNIPSPFAFNIALMGKLDILKMEDRVSFLRRMHEQVMAKISLEEGKAIKRTLQ